MADYADFIPLKDRKPESLNELERLQLCFQRDPELFVEEVLGYKLWYRQIEMFEAVRDHKYISIASGHNIGKTFVTAAICLWFVCSYPHAAVLTTATTFKQVKDVLWKEIRRMIKRAKSICEVFNGIGADVMPKYPRLDLGEDRFIEGFAFDKPDAVQGTHNPNILIVFDEAQAIDDNTAWDAFSSMMSGGNCKHLAMGNPLYPSGPFPRTHKDRKWFSMNVSCLEHPNVTTGEIVIPGAVTLSAVEEMKTDVRRGPGSLYWTTRVEGKFPQQGGNTLIAPIWVENAMKAADTKYLPGDWVGFDVATDGDDNCAVAVMKEGKIVHVEEWNTFENEHQSAARCLTIADSYQIQHDHINFDAVGPVGQMYLKAFYDMRVAANPIYGGAPPRGDWDQLWPTYTAGLNRKNAEAEEKKARKFKNRRAELHWVCRTLFQNEWMGIVPECEEKFVEQASAIRYGYWDNGELYIEDKRRKFKEREGYSPDYADAVFLTLARDSVTKPKEEEFLVGADYPNKPKHN